MPFTHIFIDIGGVLLTNGWDRSMRKEACRVFKIDYDEMNERHRLKVAAVSNEGRELDRPPGAYVRARTDMDSGSRIETFRDKLRRNDEC